MVTYPTTMLETQNLQAFMFRHGGQIRDSSETTCNPTDPYAVDQLRKVGLDDTCYLIILESLT